METETAIQQGIEDLFLNDNAASSLFEDPMPLQHTETAGCVDCQPGFSSELSQGVLVPLSSTEVEQPKLPHFKDFCRDKIPSLQRRSNHRTTTNIANDVQGISVRWLEELCAWQAELQLAHGKLCRRFRASEFGDEALSFALEWLRQKTSEEECESYLRGRRSLVPPAMKL